MLHDSDINFRIGVMHNACKEEQGFHGRQDDLAAKTMILKPGLNSVFVFGCGWWSSSDGHYLGNSCQSLMVFVSISTGMPLVFTAQCLVKPVQTDFTVIGPGDQVIKL